MQTFILSNFSNFHSLQVYQKSRYKSESDLYDDGDCQRHSILQSCTAPTFQWHVAAFSLTGQCHCVVITLRFVPAWIVGSPKFVPL